jgi:GNAT superfamily N-acetyltransferase
MPCDIRPLTPNNWSDFEKLFGARGACGGCWCMWWRKRRAEYERDKGEANRADMRARVFGGHVPGLLAYLDGEPVGWCSVAPRTEFVRLETSRTLRAVDAEPVWSVVCLFVGRSHRRRGISVELLRAAAEHARAAGARFLEGYPIVPKKREVPDMTAWTGLPGAFAAAGFEEVSRPSEARAICRRALQSR